MDITCDMCGKPCRGQGTQGRGRNQRPATSAPTPRPTTPFIPNRHPGLVPHPICPHSPICTQPTGTSRCPAPTRHPGLVSAPLMRSKRRPPRPKHPTFTQFHRSGLRFGRIHPQHRPICPDSPICTQPTDTPRCPAPTRCPGLASEPLTRSKRRPPRPKHPTFAQFHRSGLHFGRTPYNWKHVEGDTMDAHTIYTIAAHAHSTTGANNTERRRLARRAQLGELVRIAPGYYLDTEVSPRIPSHPSSSHLHGCSPCSTSIPTSSCPARPPHGSGTCHFCTSTHSTSPRFPTSTRARSHFRRFTGVHSISRRSRCAHTGREEDDHRR